MQLQCPQCNTLTHIEPQQFPELYEFTCRNCGKETRLKNDTERIVKLIFVLTSPETNETKIIPDESVESFHQEQNPMLPCCFSQQEKVLCEEQHAGVQQE